MIVPFSKGKGQQQAPPAQRPSETDLLMALAAMHQMGRVGKITKPSTPSTSAPPEPSLA